ncbi:MAG: hypothetical protein ACRD0W_16740 [Acidimicrobiales bacterium]
MDVSRCDLWGESRRQSERLPVGLFAADGISDARRVADPRGVNGARWWTLCDRALYAPNGTSSRRVWSVLDVADEGVELRRERVISSGARGVGHVDHADSEDAFVIDLKIAR